jgi:hypothetical protein
MADLSARLPTEIDSQQRFVNAAPAPPSIFESLANFGSAVAGVADRAITSLDKDAAKKSAAQDQAAKNDAAKVITGGVYSDPSMAPQVAATGQAAAVSAAKPAAQQAANFQQAANQGTLDPAAAQARGLAAMRAVMAAHPGHEAAVAEVFREMGVQNMITHQYDQAVVAQDDNAKAQRDTVNKLADAAVNKWGYTDYYQKSPEEQAVIRADVGLSELKETQLDMLTKQASISLQNAQLTNEQRTQLQTQTSSQLSGAFSQYMTSSFQNLSKIMINQLSDPTLANDPARMEKLQSHLLSVAIPALDVQFNNKLASLGPSITPADRDFITKQYGDMKASLTNMLSGPQSVVEMNKRILENLSNTYGIDYAKSAPTLMRLQKLIGPQAIGVLLSPAVQGNAQLMTMLSNELKGVIQDPSKTASFSEFVQTLAGNTDLSGWAPEKIRDAAPGYLAATVNLSKDTAASNGTDKDGHRALVNSIKNTSAIAVDVVPAWGFKSVLNQGKALNQVGVTRAMFSSQGANREEAIDAARQWMPANTRTYASLARLDAGDQFYKPVFDTHTLTWKAVWNGKGETRAMPGVGIPVTINNHPAPSSAVLEQVSVLNTSLNNLSVAAAKGYDDALGKGVSYNEARRFYSTGELPQSLQKPAGKGGKTPEQNVDDAISHMLDFVNKLPQPKAVADLSTMPLAPTVEAAAKKYGVPGDIALRLIHQESSGNPNVGDSKKGAVGPGQIMPATAAKYGISDLHSLKPEDNVDLAMHILSDNYKATGNWEDAVSMYHSGHKLADAARKGLSDGNMRTTDYTASIVGASPISPENLARYGYVRY